MIYWKALASMQSAAMIDYAVMDVGSSVYSNAEVDGACKSDIK